MGKKLWSSLTKPWLAPLMADVVLCRVVVGFCAVLGIASLAGVPIWGCPFNMLTGLPCPGCGMTRAVNALLHGNWSQAITYHPLSPAYLIIGVLLTIAATSTGAWRCRLVDGVKKLEQVTALPSMIVLFTVIFGLLRMGGACSNSAVTKPPLWRSWVHGQTSGDSAGTPQPHIH